MIHVASRLAGFPGMLQGGLMIAAGRKISLLLGALLLHLPVPAQPDPRLVSTRLKAVPVLCYHQVRERTPADSRSARAYIIPPAAFRRHIRMLHDSGFQAILPGQLTAYLLRGEKLPQKPVLICFDDGTASQFTHALPELDEAGYKAAFFIMTVVLNKPGYLTVRQVSMLVTRGHAVGCHSWDHHDVRKYSDEDWRIQLEQPTSQLRTITGGPVRFFAYPFGAWNAAACTRLREHGYTAAFQLGGKPDAGEPMYTIPRILVNGDWTAAQLLARIHAAYPRAE